jgi:hypothetical protein
VLAAKAACSGAALPAGMAAGEAAGTVPATKAAGAGLSALVAGALVTGAALPAGMAAGGSAEKSREPVSGAEVGEIALFLGGSALLMVFPERVSDQCSALRTGAAVAAVLIIDAFAITPSYPDTAGATLAEKGCTETRVVSTGRPFGNRTVSNIVFGSPSVSLPEGLA